MQKKLLAVAVASALGAPLVAQAQDGPGSSTVQVFGTMYVEYTLPGITKQGRSTAAGNPELTKADFLQTPGSEIGFKGEERLGGGLSAWYQCTTTADPRGQSQNGWCSRNSALGLKGGFGNVFIGNWDTPFKRTISPTTVGGNDTGIWGTAFLLTGDSTTDAVGANRANFKKRQNNSINYDSPNFGGFQVMATTTSSQPSTATLSNGVNNKPRVWSLGLQYSAGPLYVSGAYEQHKSYAGPVAPNGSKDSGWHIGAAYTFGPVRFGGLYTRQRWDVAPVPTGSDLRLSAWHLGVDWTIAGPHGLRAAYSQAGNMKGAAGVLIGAASGPGYRPMVVAGADTGAKLYQIRYVYTFSKRTEFNAGYVFLHNDGGAAYNLGGLNAAHVGGDKQRALAVSMRHTF